MEVWALSRWRTAEVVKHGPYEGQKYERLVMGSLPGWVWVLLQDIDGHTAYREIRAKNL